MMFVLGEVQEWILKSEDGMSVLVDGGLPVIRRWGLLVRSE